ncbi:hypothetical protein EYF80_031618 [Liparis tanakae]|uniref:Uncharacterized protein n=1 Tax=Liparis tanakae TaxID=230148 RepID=A0A4Z2GYK5_9TELE|nr:hypothetical protein EYF80_031618 [Liparis tanakae]
MQTPVREKALITVTLRKEKPHTGEGMSDGEGAGVQLLQHGGAELPRVYRRRLDRVAAAVPALVPLTLADEGQQRAQLGHRDGAVVSVAGQQVLEHLGGGLRPTFPLTCHSAHGAQKQHRQGQN